MSTLSYWSILGDPECGSLAWNPNWKDAKGQIDWVCKFRQPGLTGHDKDNLSKESTYYKESVSGLSFHSEAERDLYSPEAVSARSRIAHLLASLVTYTDISQYHHLLGLSTCQVGFYLDRPGIVRSYPLLQQIMADKSPSRGFVYLISDQQGHYKIGKANNLDRRIYQLGTQPPFRLELIDSVACSQPLAIEANLHKELATSRLDGEWFQLNPDQVRKIRQRFQGLRNQRERLHKMYADMKAATFDYEYRDWWFDTLWDRMQEDYVIEQPTATASAVPEHVADTQLYPPTASNTDAENTFVN